MTTKQLPADPPSLVRHLRGDRTQEEFARMIGVSEATICHIESGRRNLTYRTAIRLANSCGFPKYEIAELAAEHYGYDLGGYRRMGF